MEHVWLVGINEYDDEGQLVSVEVIAYASEQTAKQHADRDGGVVRRETVRTKLREY